MGTAHWGPAAYPDAITSAQVARATDARTATALDESPESHLHSCRSVAGFHIRAGDGEIGHVDDFIFDDRSWAIRYLRVDTSNWIGGKAVLVPQRALQDVRWHDSTIRVALTREQVKNSPEYDADLLNAEDERRLDDYFYGKGRSTR
jgi:hypothetical protein